MTHSPTESCELQPSHLLEGLLFTSLLLVLFNHMVLISDYIWTEMLDPARCRCPDEPIINLLLILQGTGNLSQGTLATRWRTPWMGFQPITGHNHTHTTNNLKIFGCGRKPEYLEKSLEVWEEHGNSTYRAETEFAHICVISGLVWTQGQR